MVETVSVENSAPKALKYEQIIPQIQALIGNEKHQISVFANVSSALHHAFQFFWTGFYLLEGNELRLGPFQGPVACMSINVEKGVCGAAIKRNETIVVTDVQNFPEHIACNALSKSEIVVPVRNGRGEIQAILDIDSASIATFDQVDRKYLEQICDWIGEHIY